MSGINSQSGRGSRMTRISACQQLCNISLNVRAVQFDNALSSRAFFYAIISRGSVWHWISEVRGVRRKRKRNITLINFGKWSHWSWHFGNKFGNKQHHFQSILERANVFQNSLHVSSDFLIFEFFEKVWTIENNQRKSENL